MVSRPTPGVTLVPRAVWTVTAEAALAPVIEVGLTVTGGQVGMAAVTAGGQANLTHTRQPMLSTCLSA